MAKAARGVLGWGLPLSLSPHAFSQRFRVSDFEGCGLCTQGFCSAHRHSDLGSSGADRPPLRSLRRASGSWAEHFSRRDDPSPPPQSVYTAQSPRSPRSSLGQGHSFFST